MAQPTVAQHDYLSQWFFPLIYDFILWLCTLCLDIFFREVQPRSAWRVPKKGPVIVVAGPHANQFIDSLILMQVLKTYGDRRISFLIAEKSMKERFIGSFARCFGSLPVARTMDCVKPAVGKVYLPIPDSDPKLVRGVGTDFTTSAFMVGGTIVLPRVGNRNPGMATIAEILSPTELRLKRPFDLEPELERSMYMGMNETPEGVTFKVAPYIDQTQVFDTASNHLLRGGCIGIFPEGGSHDRPDLLPLKAGVSIMALNTLAMDPDCGLTIVPCGMNYFHPHKFRSRAVIEFGPAIDVHPDQIEAYRSGGSARRDAVGSLLETIYQGLVAVTQVSPDYETLMLVQATRRLYNPIGKKLPLSAVVELNRRLLKAYIRYQEDPRIKSLKRAVMNYNHNLRALGIKDHQIEWGDNEKRPWWLILGTFVYRIGEIAILSIGTLPGLLLFWPVFVLAKIISVRKREKALAASVVKLRGRDVVTTWKLLVSAGIAPTLYLFYTAVAAFWLHYNRVQGYYSSQVPWYLLATTYVPKRVPVWTFGFASLIMMVTITFAALRIGEIGMDIIKSLPPLIAALNPFSQSFARLRLQRQALATQVTDLINALGPELFDDFDRHRITADAYREGAYQSQLKPIRSNKSDSLSRGRDRSLSGSFLSSLSFSDMFTPLSGGPDPESDSYFPFTSTETLDASPSRRGRKVAAQTVQSTRSNHKPSDSAISLLSDEGLKLLRESKKEI